MRHHLILRVITKLLVAPILLFALYVQFHGDYSPGGGFQAGVIFAAAFILYGVVFGLGKSSGRIPTLAGAKARRPWRSDLWQHWPGEPVHEPAIS